MRRTGALATGLASLLSFSVLGDASVLRDPPSHSVLTKRAAQAVRFVAGLLSGHAVLRFRWTAEGALRRDILSAACPVPEETPEQRLARLHALSDQKRDEWISYLSKLADSDGSGSVSDEEGKRFRRRSFTGLTAARLPDLQSAAQLAQLLEEAPSQVAEDLAAYSVIQQTADQDGMLGFPALSSALMGPSNDEISGRSRRKRWSFAADLSVRRTGFRAVHRP